MRLLALLALCILLLAGTGCAHNAYAPVHFVVVLDTSASINPESQKQAFQAVEELASRLKRGDSLSVVPILDDADTELQGRILRLHVPEQREAYDADLKRFREEALKRLLAFRHYFLSNPGERTDIVGTLPVATEEFADDFSQTHRVLILLSDLIEDDGELNFRTDPKIADKEAAQKLAHRMPKADLLASKSIRVYLGELRSRELASLRKERRTAIRQFWISYFEERGLSCRLSTDGPAGTRQAGMRELRRCGVQRHYQRCRTDSTID